MLGDGFILFVIWLLVVVIIIFLLFAVVRFFKLIMYVLVYGFFRIKLD